MNNRPRANPNPRPCLPPRGSWVWQPPISREAADGRGRLSTAPTSASHRRGGYQPPAREAHRAKLCHCETVTDVTVVGSALRVQSAPLPPPSGRWLSEGAVRPQHQRPLTRCTRSPPAAIRLSRYHLPLFRHVDPHPLLDDPRRLLGAALPCQIGCDLLLHDPHGRLVPQRGVLRPRQ